MTPGPVSDSSPGPSDGSSVLDDCICVVFSGSGPDLTFVEVEDPDGKGLSKSVGGWGQHTRNPELSTLSISPRSIMHALGHGDQFEVLNCAFCGFEYVGPENPTPRDRLDAHIRSCPEHPARELVQLLIDIETELKEAKAATPEALENAPYASSLTLSLTERTYELLKRWAPDQGTSAGRRAIFHKERPAYPKDQLDRLVEKRPLTDAEREIETVRIVLRGHTEECSAMKSFFGTASEDPGCDCGYQKATDDGIGREVYDSITGDRHGRALRSSEPETEA